MKGVIAIGLVVVSLLGIDAGADKVLDQIKEQHEMEVVQAQRVEVPQNMVKPTINLWEVRECLTDLSDVAVFNANLKAWDNGQITNSAINPALKTQYRTNEEASSRLLIIFNTIDTSDSIKTDLVKIMGSADKFRYEMNRLPLNYVDTLDAEIEMLEFIQSFNNKH